MLRLWCRALRAAWADAKIFWMSKTRYSLRLPNVSAASFDCGWRVTDGRRGMRRLIANEWVTLDGVVRAPSYPDEDNSGALRHGAGMPATSKTRPCTG